MFLAVRRHKVSLFLCIFNSKKRVKKLVEIWETYMVRSNNYTERKGVLFCCIMLKEVWEKWDRIQYRV